MKSIDLRKLTHAVAVADTASYARASERLHLTQSALTRSIQALEMELGIQLFDRGKSGVRTTSDGEKILAKARYLLLQARTLEREVNLLKLAESGEIAFGVGPAMPCLFLPDLLTTLCSQHPDLRIEVAVESGYRMQEMLREELIEFFVADTNQLTGLDGHLFSTEALVDIPAGFFVRSGHPLRERNSVKMTDLRQYPLISPRHRSDFRLQNRLTDDSSEVSEPLKQILCNDLSSLRQMVQQTDAILIGIPHMVGEELASGLVCKLPLQGVKAEPVCGVTLVSLAGRTPSMAATRICTEIRRLVLSSKG